MLNTTQDATKELIYYGEDSKHNVTPSLRFTDSTTVILVDNVKIKKLTDTARLPSKASTLDYGYDLYSDESVLLWPFQRKLISTGIAFADMNKVFGGIIKDRSSVAWKRGLFVHAGVIDSGYRGEIKVLLYNGTLLPKKINAGERIAQLILMPVFNANIVESDVQTETTRGAGGFGSTGI